MAIERWKSLTPDEVSEWRQLWSEFPKEPSYKQIGQHDLPNSMPSTLKAKIDNAVVMTSGTSEGTVVMVCNLCRVDKKASAVDQQPFAIVFDANGNAESGVYLDHGDWTERTTTPPKEFWDYVEESGVGDYFYPSLPEGSQSGTLDSLPLSSHGDAFNDLVTRFRNAEMRKPS